MQYQVLVNTDRGNERIAYVGSYEDCDCYIAENYTPHEQVELDITIQEQEYE